MNNHNIVCKDNHFFVILQKFSNKHTMNKRFFILAMAFATTLCSEAKVRLHHLISNNMVLQSNTQARLWGWDSPGKTIRVSVSWDQQTYTSKAAKDGRWEVSVHTPKAGYTPLSITFDDGEKTTVSNVLSGEVWVCAGQSNMEMPIRGFWGCPVEGYNGVVVDARKHSGIRYAKIPSTMAMKPQADADTKWQVVSPETVQNASATGYFFGRMLENMLGVPVGLIEANKGGTRVESWLDADNLKKNTDERLDSVSIYSQKTDYYRPLVWGNGTFAPIQKYTVKGIVYYQGCSNVGYHMDQYAQRLQLLVAQWRKAFGLGDIPFYFTEIAPYWYDNANGTNAAILREQQYIASTKITNCGFVGNNDGAYKWEMKQIHPSQKRKVGERLAYYALSQTYGQKGLIYKNPSYESMTVSGSEITVKLRDTENGIYPLYGIEGFEICGNDGKFYPAAARYDWHGGIVVSSPKVHKPTAVRYCFRNFQLGTARNQGGLPLLPFRTDKK